MHYHQKEIIENSSSSSSSREFLNFVLNAFCPRSTTARSRHSFQPCFSIDHFEKCIIHIISKSLKNFNFQFFFLIFEKCCVNFMLGGVGTFMQLSLQWVLSKRKQCRTLCRVLSEMASFSKWLQEIYSMSFLSSNSFFFS